MEFLNSWDNAVRSASYSKLEFPNTYYLAYRDLPAIISKHVSGNTAVDFGCGTGRSTRFLKKLGFDTIGIDISKEMLQIAKELDTTGNYYFVEDGNYEHLGKNFDLVLCVFTFDNIPGKQNRVNILKGLKKLLKSGGTLICLDANSEMYTMEWASFSTFAFSENQKATSGDKVKIVMTDVDDQSPVEDILWTISDYYEMFIQAGCRLVQTYSPLGYADEPYNWISEKCTAPWIIYVVQN